MLASDPSYRRARLHRQLDNPALLGNASPLPFRLLDVCHR
jgi:hypothetical protein